MTTFLPWVDAETELASASTGTPHDPSPVESNAITDFLTAAVSDGGWPTAPRAHRHADLVALLHGLLHELRSTAVAKAEHVRRVRDGEVVPNPDALTVVEIPDSIAANESLAVLAVETYHERGRPLASAAAHEVGAQVNLAYFCAGPDSRGFPPHYDVFHTILVQLEGSKRWSVHRGPVENPMLDHEWPDVAHLYPEDALKIAVDPLEITLKPGDVLWIPQGWVHGGQASEEGSTHATVGVRTPRVYDLIREVVESSIALPWIRAEVPPLRRGTPAASDGMVLDALASLQLSIGLTPHDRFLNAESHWRSAFVAGQFE